MFKPESGMPNTDFFRMSFEDPLLLKFSVTLSHPYRHPQCALILLDETRHYTNHLLTITSHMLQISDHSTIASAGAPMLICRWRHIRHGHFFGGGGGGGGEFY